MTVLPRRTRGIAVPYGQPEIVGDRGGPGGASRLYIESFDQDSWADLPASVPIVHSHDRRWVLGRGHLTSRRDGLMVSIEWLDQHAGAADAVAEIRSGLVRGLSISFRPDPKHDIVQQGNRKAGLPGILPKVTRRGAQLKDVALTIQPAYRGAVITAIDEDQANHAAGAAVLAQARAHVEPVIAARRAANDEFLATIGRTVAAARASIAGVTGHREQNQVVLTRTRPLTDPALPAGHHVLFRGHGYLVPRTRAATGSDAIRHLEALAYEAYHRGSSFTEACRQQGIALVPG